jgi:Calcineurin-like phosphoesterase
MQTGMRIVAMSDLHGHLPEIPPCDLLIIAGDVCPDRFGPLFAVHAPDQQALWFNQTVRPWLDQAPATRTILTWGNHDWCGELTEFRRDSPAEAPGAALNIVVDLEVRVPAGKGDEAVSVWATPWSNLFLHWAFMKPPAALADVYATIPAGIDILVSHQPPHGFGDRFFNVATGAAEHLGSRELLSAIERVRPKLVICGHIHGAHGRYVHKGIPIYNVSVVDEQYSLVYKPTVLDFGAGSSSA